MNAIIMIGMVDDVNPSTPFFWLEFRAESK
jgi:hypothetical protein